MKLLLILGCLVAVSGYAYADVVEVKGQLSCIPVTLHAPKCAHVCKNAGFTLPVQLTYEQQDKCKLGTTPCLCLKAINGHLGQPVEAEDLSQYLK